MGKLLEERVTVDGIVSEIKQKKGKTLIKIDPLEEKYRHIDYDFKGKLDLIVGAPVNLIIDKYETGSLNTLGKIKKLYVKHNETGEFIRSHEPRKTLTEQIKTYFSNLLN